MIKNKTTSSSKNSLIAREKEKERKARTRRLIELGAIFDSIGIDTLEKQIYLNVNLIMMRHLKTCLLI
ncbi:conjugal transfer protein TraD [Clostridium neonatale]|uniref:Uncharacterized protein n=1 Tax=Clostridium neonatale TaxID=137838 RepID=A0AA86JKA0_9CLOT|nr:hypothetical protein CNEO_50013 [Clostridium neonatale]